MYPMSQALYANKLPEIICIPYARKGPSSSHKPGQSDAGCRSPEERITVIGPAYFPKELLLSSVSFSLLDPNA